MEFLNGIIIILLIIPASIICQENRELEAMSDNARSVRFGFGRLETLRNVWRTVCNRTCSASKQPRLFGSPRIFCAVKCPGWGTTARPPVKESITQKNPTTNSETITPRPTTSPPTTPPPTAPPLTTQPPATSPPPTEPPTISPPPTEPPTISTPTDGQTR